ncbi:MAG: peptidoglycan editing factor PgeF [Anaerolineales bacterium]|nr:peptidoglycan editing factor PgeF [Anaerolineales bacterium]
MPFHENNGLRYYSFDIFSTAVAQAVFTRRGGVSPVPWHSLNLGGSVGDDPAHVMENRIRSFDALGRAPASIHDVWLVHSADIVYADEARPRTLDHPPQRADIILTDNSEVSLFMRFADCVPLLFHDPRKHVIGIAHAGWMGTVKGVAKNTIAGMQSRYGCKPENIIVGIGPSIGADHYEVREDVTLQFREKYGKDAGRVIQTRAGKSYLDLWAANEIQLRSAGVEQIQVSGLCTACHLDDWFSHRAEKGKTGRFGVLMALA